jgi:hypothetical protein
MASSSLRPLLPNPGADPLVLDQLLAPAQQLLEKGYVRHVYRDGPVDDLHFVRLGVTRVVSQSVSGRDFLQLTREVHGDSLARSSFFDSLHSTRRRDLLAQLNTELARRQRVSLPDLLSRYPELRGRALYAVDGHHLAHAVHARRDAEGDFVSCNSLYVLCLHSGLLLNLGAVQGEGVRRHEMPVFRQRIVPWLTQHPSGRGAPPIFVVDPAFVDKQFWTRMAVMEQRQALMITRTKENMKPVVYGSRPWDPQAPVNQGVRADESVGLDNSVILRRIGYRDPESGVEYEFLTTVRDLAPGLIALLYLLRWRIEKVFDTGKNKLQETKAWATGQVAQEIQAHCFALTHNLLVCLRAQLDQREGIRELKVEKKRQQSLITRRAQAAAHGRAVPRHQERLPAVVQLTVQFIRTLRNAILVGMRWLAALARLRESMEFYL